VLDANGNNVLLHVDATSLLNPVLTSCATRLVAPV
jgi:hypothetical protein